MLKKKSTLFALCLTSLLAVYGLQGAGQSALWTNRLNGAGDNADRYNQTVMDASGNLYSAGYTVNPGTGKDFLVVKMNTVGDTLWTRQFNHTANLDDEANYLTLTAAGEIVVTGYSDGGSASSKTDILTIKYSTAGSLLWSARYNYTTANEDDLPAGLAVDASGNVFVSGRSDHDAANIDDLVTIKYNSAGTEQWVARFDGGLTDRSAGVVADQAGGCVVTGRTDNGTNDDILTISYSTTGSVNWQTIYTGAAGDDRGQSIARDATGNVYVAGIRANVDDDDFVTIKYNASGTQQWVKIFNGVDNDRVSLLKLDNAGNVYVTGQSDIDGGGNADYNFRTIKYDAAGTLLWNTVTGNPAAQEDTPTDMYIDASGNVYVTGKSDGSAGAAVDFEWMTVKYNSSGLQQWIKYYDGTTAEAEDIPASVLVDVSGNMWVTGSIDFSATQKDATALRYSSLGILNLTKTLNGKGDFNDKVNAIATDASGNTYVTGYTMNAGQQRNVFLQKINSAGVTQWTRTFDGTGENDEGNAVSVDAVGNIYVAGYSNGAGTFDDMLLLKYNAAGVFQWSAIYDHAAHQLDKAVAMVISAAGDIYITGYSDGDASAVTNYDIATLKYNSLGLLQWATRFNGAGNGNDRPADILFDGTGLLVAGTAFSGVNNDVVLISYDILGVQLLQTTYNGASNGDDQAEDMVLDGTSIYITGYAFVTGNAEDYLTLKYSTAFTLQWAKTYNGTGDLTDKAFGVAVTAGEVYVTGSSKGTSGAADLALIKYNKTTGAQNWAKRYTGTGAYSDEGYSVITDGVDNIYTTGMSGNAASVSDFITLNYNGAGTKLLTLKYNGTGNNEDVARRAILDNNGYLYVTGYSTGSGKNNWDFTTIKYCTPVPTATVTALGPTTFCTGGSVTLSANTGAGFTYQWKKGNANIAGATASIYVATTSGGYKVVVTNGNGCTKTSGTVNVSSIICREDGGVEEEWIVAASPNPFNESTVVTITGEHAEVVIELWDLTGRLITTVIADPSATSVEVGADLPAGNYLLVVRTPTEVRTQQLVKM